MQTLLVEDDLAAAHEIATAIEEEGFLCDVASSTAEAQDFLRHGTYSVAVLDYYLRSETTLFLASHIRLRHPATKIVTITGSPLFASGFGLNQLGADFLFRKPFAVSDLIEIMRYLELTADASDPLSQSGALAAYSA